MVQLHPQAYTLSWGSLGSIALLRSCLSNPHREGESVWVSREPFSVSFFFSEIERLLWFLSLTCGAVVKIGRVILGSSLRTCSLSSRGLYIHLFLMFLSL